MKPESEAFDVKAYRNTLCVNARGGADVPSMSPSPTTPASVSGRLYRAPAAATRAAAEHEKMKTFSEPSILWR